MKTILPDPRFANLTIEQVEEALDLYDSLEDEDSDDGEEAPCSCCCAEKASQSVSEACESAEAPSEEMLVIAEVERLIAAYSEKFEAYCQENDGEIPEEALLFRPDSAIAQVAFGIFTEALHDSLMDEDDE